MAFGHAGEAVELGAVAVERDDQRAVGGGARIGLAPQRDAAAAKLAHDGFGALLLAIRREHGAGIEAAAMGEGHRRALAQRDLMPAARQRERLPEADDAGATDGDRLFFVMPFYGAWRERRVPNPRAPRLRGVDRRRLAAHRA